MFVEEYLSDFNATQAAIRAGYSHKTAHSSGPRLLENVGVAQAIEKAIDARSARTRVTADRVVKELARVAFADMRNFVEWGPDSITLKESSELSQDDSAAVTEVSETSERRGVKTLKFKLAHKDSALKVLAQHTGVLGSGIESHDGSDFLRGAAAQRALYLEQKAREGAS
jgi:phage terminase small subunit